MKWYKVEYEAVGPESDSDNTNDVVSNMSSNEIPSSPRDNFSSHSKSVISFSNPSYYLYLFICLILLLSIFSFYFTNKSKQYIDDIPDYILPPPNWTQIVETELSFFRMKHHCTLHRIINQVHHYQGSNYVSKSWHKFIKILLQEYIIPDVEFYISCADMEKHPTACLASSINIKNPSPAITNWQVIAEMVNGALRKHRNPIPWKDRENIFYWRGSIGGFHPPEHWRSRNMSNETLMEKLSDKSRRLYAVMIGRKHDFLDIEISGGKPRLHKMKFWGKGNKGRELFPFKPIPADDYYTKPKFHIVLCGIGAAFRATRHFQEGNVMLLQHCRYQEWFMKYAVNGIHYVGIEESLSNLVEKARWVLNHPREAEQMSKRAMAFFDTYLKFNATKEFVVTYLKTMATRNYFWNETKT